MLNHYKNHVLIIVGDNVEAYKLAWSFINANPVKLSIFERRFFSKMNKNKDNVIEACRLAIDEAALIWEEI